MAIAEMIKTIVLLAAASLPMAFAQILVRMAIVVQPMETLVVLGLVFTPRPAVAVTESVVHWRGVVTVVSQNSELVKSNQTERLVLACLTIFAGYGILSF
jgi:hypothetical protein